MSNNTNNPTKQTSALISAALDRLEVLELEELVEFLEALPETDEREEVLAEVYAAIAKVESNNVKRIAELNDLFRKESWLSGRWRVTAGIVALLPEEHHVIFKKVRDFNNFTPDNDPYGERNFGAFDHNGQKIFWKIDYYDHTLTYGSENPADPEQTVRVLTIMLADEY